MATTGLNLGIHWENFIREQVSSGRYSSASEVIRDALQAMEERFMRLEALRHHLAEGALQAGESDFVEDFTIETVIDELNGEK